MKLHHLALTASLLLAPLAGTQAAAVSLDVEFRDSSYRVRGADSFTDLLDAFNAASVISRASVSSLEGINTRELAGGITRDYGVMMTASLAIADAGNYRFQVGTDWGRGGGVALFDRGTGSIVEEFVTSNDIWWHNRWSHPDVIETDFDLARGLYTIAWLGFENCCAGSSSIRFAFEGGAFRTLNLDNVALHAVPLPASLWLLASTLAGLLGVRNRRAAGTA